MQINQTGWDWPARPTVDPTEAGAGGRFDRRASARLGGLFLLLVGLVTLLPAPWSAPGPGPTVAAAGQLGGSAAESAMLLVTASVAWLVLSWLVVAAGVALLTRIPGIAGASAGRVLRQLTPRVLRTALLTVVGASMLTGVAACGTGQAAAASIPASPSVAPGRAAVEGSVVRPGQIDLDWPGRSAAPPSAPHPVPTGPVNLDWPAAKTSGRLSVPAPAAATPVAPVPAPVGHAASVPTRVAAAPVVVLRGDSLWSIAARHLPPDADSTTVERAWPQWFSVNSSVIGTDPNLILPGQILLPPTSGTGA